MWSPPLAAGIFLLNDVLLDLIRNDHRYDLIYGSLSAYLCYTHTAVLLLLGLKLGEFIKMELLYWTEDWEAAEGPLATDLIRICPSARRLAQFLKVPADGAPGLHKERVMIHVTPKTHLSIINKIGRFVSWSVIF